VSDGWLFATGMDASAEGCDDDEVSGDVGFGCNAANDANDAGCG
jgi:hypothetical protein